MNSNMVGQNRNDPCLHPEIKFYKNQRFHFCDFQVLLFFTRKSVFIAPFIFLKILQTYFYCFPLFCNSQVQ